MQTKQNKIIMHIVFYIQRHQSSPGIHPGFYTWVIVLITASLATSPKGNTEPANTVKRKSYPYIINMMFLIHYNFHMILLVIGKKEHNSTTLIIWTKLLDIL